MAFQSWISEPWYKAETPAPGSASAGVSRVSFAGGGGCSAGSQWQQPRAGRQSRGGGGGGAQSAPVLLALKF